MKFLLTSIYANVADKLPELLNDTPENTTVAFIATAADVYEDKSFVDVDRNKLKEQGFKIREVNLTFKNSEELEKELRDCQVIFVAGGNVFYLLQEAQKSNFGAALKALNPETVYVGSSAGAVLVGPDIEFLDTLDDPSKAPELKEYRGLGLVDVVVLPHYGKLKYEGRYRQILEKISSKGLQAKTLKDNEYIIYL